MEISQKTPCKKIMSAIAGGAGLFCITQGSIADVTFDGSLGPGGTLNGPVMEITADRGQMAGNNLFHSFSEFNVDSGQTANFSGPDNVQNIFGRVTGGNPSSIEGTISSSIQDANLFLMNPNGMMFGPNAQINISGSFHATTADYLSFGDQKRFYADITQATTLSVAAPSAFGFLDNTTGNITATGSTLSVQDGKTIAFVGGNIALTDGASISAPEGSVNIASAQSAGEFHVMADQTDLSSFERLGTITLGDYSVINANDAEAGKIVIRGGELVLVNSTVSANASPGATNIDSNSIDIQLSDTLLLDDYSAINSIPNSTLDTGSGDINIAAPNIQILNNSSINTDTTESGVSGAIFITASNLKIKDDSVINSGSGDINIQSNNIELGTRAWIHSTVNEAAGGNININADSISITDGGTIETENHGSHQGGFINMNTGNMTLSGINTQIPGEYFRSAVVNTTQGSGNAGNIIVSTDNLEVLDGAVIVSNTAFGSGDAGDIIIYSNDLLVSGINDTAYRLAISDNKFALANARSAIRSEAFFVDIFGFNDRGPGGNAGNISLTAANVTIRDGAWIDSKAISTRPTATNSGDISINSNQLVLENGGSINSTIENAGNAGDIHIKSQSTKIEGSVSEVDQTGIFSSTSEFSTGLGGNITIESDLLNVENGAEVNAETGGTGTGGNLYIDSGIVEIRNNGLVSTGSHGTGTAGNINITNAKKIYVTHNGVISTTTQQADGGNITIDSESLVYQMDGTINTSVNGSVGDGGNIKISTDVYVLNNSQVTANAHEGKGGNISISADRFILDNNSIIDASSQLGLDGQVNIEINGDNVTNPEKLPDSKDDVTNQFTTLCSPYPNKKSRLVISPILPINLDNRRFSSSEYDSIILNLNNSISKHNTTKTFLGYTENLNRFVQNSTTIASCD